MNIDRIKVLFCQLERFLKKYGDVRISNQYLIVNHTIAFLNSEESDDNKVNCALRNYKSLFVGKGGLMDFYVWDDDFEKRLKINEPYERITDELWILMKDYI